MTIRSWRSGALAFTMALVLSSTSAGIAVDASGAAATPTSAKSSSAKRASARRPAARATSTAKAAGAHAAVAAAVAPNASASASPHPTAAVASAGTASNGTSEGTSPVAKYAADPAAVKRGRQLFVGSCGAYCHSTHDEERDAPSLFDCTWRHGGSDAEIFTSISSGYAEKRMPAWKGVLPQGDDDIWRVIAYLRSTSTCNAAAAAVPAAPAAH